MQKGLKYVIFKTKSGFFGFLSDKRGLLRTALPITTYQKTKKYLLVGIFDAAKEDKNLYLKLQKAIKAYYKGSYVDFARHFSGLVCFEGSEFAKKVLKTCIKIPPGQTITYAQLAKKAGFPKAARAVGSVLAKNKLPLIIPCHRVVCADGKIGNFSAPGGTKVKRKMIDYEKNKYAKCSRCDRALFAGD